MHCHLVSAEEITKTYQLHNEQELSAQEALTFCKPSLRNMDNDSQVKCHVSAIKHFWNLSYFGIKTYKNIKI